MADVINPSDIGLALSQDVGDVSNLLTASKVIVEAINELKETGTDVVNGEGSSIGTFEQIYHVGDNNVILGKNNIVHGNNNIIIGDDNIVCGDNLIIIGNKKQIYKSQPYYYDNANIPSGKLYFYSPEGGALGIAVGDKVLLNTYISYTTQNYNGYFNTSTEPYFAEVISVDNQNFTVTVDSIQLPTAIVPSEFIYRDYESVSIYTFFNDSCKVIGNSSITLGNLAEGTNSFTANISKALGAYSFAANSGNAKKSHSFAVNYGEADGVYSLAANYGKAFSSQSAAFNYSYCYGKNGFTANGAKTAGRAIKCVSTNTSQKSITAAAGENVSGLTGSYIIYRNRNSNNPALFSYLKVKSVTGQTLYIENFPTGAGQYEYVLMPDKYIFCVDENTQYMFASGYSIAGGNYAEAHGFYTLSVHEGAAIYGKYGVTPETYSFSLANGTSHDAQGLAVKMLQNGNVYADGTFSSPCADYSEFFEWLDGNPDSEDRAGLFVTLEGDKIKVANDFEDWLTESGFILGVISANPAIIGDTGELRWADKYITDDFGRIMYHDVIVPEEKDRDGNILIEEHMETQPVLNPNWNPETEYTPRTKRKEWSAVGVLGKLRVRDDGTCVVGGMCRPTVGGIATKSIKNGYRVLKRISDNIILIWVR